MNPMHPLPADDPYFSQYVDGRQGEILDAALRVFAEKGYDGGSMREIAQRVGVTEPAIYRHFGSKEELFVALIKVGAIHLHATAFQAIDGLRADGIRAQLLGVMTSKRGAMTTVGPMIRNMLPVIARNPLFRETYRDQIVLPVLKRVCDKAAELDGDFNVADAAATREARVRALMALFVGYTVTAFVLEDEPEDAIVDAALRVMEWDAS